jgi:hypothetical protein
MVKHIVMWRLKDAGDAARQREHALAVKCDLEALAGRISGLLCIEVGFDFCQDASAADIVLYSEFTDRAALEAYQVHPAHLAVRPRIGAVTVERRVVDYEI